MLSAGDVFRLGVGLAIRVTVGPDCNAMFKCLSKEKAMELVLVVLAVAGWLLLNAVVLPRFGMST